MSAESPAALVASLDLDLSGIQRDQLVALLVMLAADEHAPTAIREPRRALDVHVADSLAALEVEALRVAKQIADLGSGAGFPGLVLAVALPGAQVHLVESQVRSCDFLVRAARTAGLANVRVVSSRAEAWIEGLARNDAVVARALAPQAVVLEYAAPLLRVGGSLVDWRGRRSHAEEEAASEAAKILGLERRAIGRVTPFAGARERHLHEFAKVRETPSRFPRRAGAARKRPLAV